MHDEMRLLSMDRQTTERLLAGKLDPDDAPPGYSGVARMVRTLAAPAGRSELEGESAAVVAATAVLQRRAIRPDASGTPVPRKAHSRFFRTKVASLVVVGTLIGTTGLAAAGVLPAPIQDAASTALSKVGISVPSSTDVTHPSSTGEDVSKLATTTDLTGVDKGAAISSLASGGISQAGQHGQAAQSDGASTPPGQNGRGTADQASGGRSSTGSGSAP